MSDIPKGTSSVRVETSRSQYRTQIRGKLEGYAGLLMPAQDIGNYDKVPASYSTSIKTLQADFKGAYTDMVNDVIGKQVALAFRNMNSSLSQSGMQKNTGMNQFVDDFLSDWTKQKFHGKTINQRLNVAAVMFGKQTRAMLKTGVREGFTNAELQAALKQLYTRSSTNFKGVSPYHWADRLLMGEAKRAYWDAMKEAAKQAGVEYLQWFLNPNCKHCKICNYYANTTDPTVTGVEGMPAGVFRREKFPDSPHPYCGCVPGVYVVK